MQAKINEKTAELVIIGGGPAGMAAAIAASNKGIRDIVILEREKKLGGILQQCIHNGFGLHYFGEELTGPEYAWRFIDEVRARGISYFTETTVLSLNEEKIITAINSAGLFTIRAKAIVLAMGCRERTRGALNIPGARPAGIYTAGAAQKYVNLHGVMPGKSVVILGSGDIGLIMARRLTLEGAQVKMVCELLPYSGGLTRNIVQCLDDFEIPLKLSHTVTAIHGRERLEGVTIARVGPDRKPEPDTCEYVPCDTLLLSVGLIPENELSREAGVTIDAVTAGPVVDDSMQTSIEGVFACGNVVHVHDLVDYVSKEGARAGECAAKHILGQHTPSGPVISVVAGLGVRYTVPQKIQVNGEQDKIKIFFRVTDVYQELRISARLEGRTILERKKVKATPGEMEYLEIPAALLGSNPKPQELIISVEKNPQQVKPNNRRSDLSQQIRQEDS